MMFTGIAKPTPVFCPVRLAMAVFMPISRPWLSKSGPPELPGLIAASIWMIDLIVRLLRAGSERFKLEMMPVVSVRSSPNGLPMANTCCPTFSLVESPKIDREEQLRRGVDLDHGHVARDIAADDSGFMLRAVEQRDLDFIGPFDDVIVGQDVALLVRAPNRSRPLPANCRTSGSRPCPESW